MYFLRSRVIRIARLRFAAAFIAAYLFEAGAFWIYLHRDESPYYVYAAAAAHILSSLSFIIFTSPKRRSLPGVGYYYPRIAALFSLFMPLIGLVGMSMTLFVSRMIMSSHGLAEEYKEKAYESNEVEVDMPSDVTEFLYDEVDIHPIADVLAGSDMGMKRGAVNLLRRIGSAEAVKLLRKSLSDENAEVRFYSHTALTRLEEDYARSIEKSRFKAEKYDSAQSHADLAGVYRNYARSGLPEVNMQEQSMLQSCEHWKIATEKDPGNTDFLMRLAEVYIESRQFSEAIKIYKEAEADPELEMESRLGVCRAFFEMGNFISLFQEVQKLQSLPTLKSSDPFKTMTYNFWISDSSDLADSEYDLDGQINRAGDAAYE
ncbi:hypothetical protein [Maridesulfovibrio hydrothermalis]|uniref:Uncharacterized protein n=1 Tax=Maridesulfovibrio hydrothermalis AM13 = DSM 14728 TaxID=1121451 RepID=L0RD05_9BACT|nr:hypothetical protein [Maridesulfovibrio hydrothermalis]CCO24107.1 conserved membrane protein of unknown function [Maridesulfovibrio hydrothermalis AM13 = DSM 14728]